MPDRIQNIQKINDNTVGYDFVTPTVSETQDRVTLLAKKAKISTLMSDLNVQLNEVNLLLAVFN